MWKNHQVLDHLDKAMEHADAVCIAAGLKKDTLEWYEAWEAARKEYPMPSLI